MSASRRLSPLAAVGAAAAAVAIPSPSSAQTQFGASRADDVLAAPAADGTPAPRNPWQGIDLGPDMSLTFGLDWKERVEASDRPILGIRGGGSGVYVLSRVLVDADLHVGGLRLFVQAGAHSTDGRNGAPLPTDRDDLDLQQAFVEWKGGVAGGEGRIRLGRQEMVYDEGLFVSLRDGPNVRRAWDGVRATFRKGYLTADAFTARPVAVRPGVFDDVGTRGERLSGLHLTVTPSASVRVDGFYYHSEMPRFATAAGVTASTTDTVGGRVRLTSPSGGDASLGYDVQWGRSGALPVRAFALQAAAGWTFKSAWTPRVFVRADVLSGGDPRDGTVRTFNPLYPNYAYSTEAAIESPSNLVEYAGGVTAHPSKSVTVQYVAEALFRYSRADTFYVAPGIPLAPTDGMGSRYSGLEQQVNGSWHVSPSMTLSAAAVRVAASRSLRGAGARSETFGVLSVLLRI